MTTLAKNDPCWCGSGRAYKRCHRLADIDPSAAASAEAKARSHELAQRRVKPGTISPLRLVPESIARPAYARGLPADRGSSAPKTADEIARMRVAGQAAAEVLALLGAAVRPGITTEELDAICHQACVDRGGYPSPLGYYPPNPDYPYPKAVCTSVNEVICHGIPDSTVLADGDIVNCDVTIYLDGVHGDTNATFYVGTPDDRTKHLVETTRACLLTGIDAVRPGGTIRDIGRAIEKLAVAEGLGVVRAFVGHGIGTAFHSGPQVFHYDNPAAASVIEVGQTFTIEPMITLGRPEHEMWGDGWTAVTRDRSWTAQFEHTLLVTDDGAEILTLV